MLSTEFSCLLPSILVVIMSPTFNVGQENLYFGRNVWQKHFRWPPMGALLMDSSHKKMDGFWSLLKLGANSIALQHIRKSLDCGRWKTHTKCFFNLGWDVGAEWKESWQKSLIPPQNIKGVKVIFMESAREGERMHIWNELTLRRHKGYFFHVKGYFFTAKGIFSRQRVNCATQPL